MLLLKPMLADCASFVSTSALASRPSCPATAAAAAPTLPRHGFTPDRT